LGAWSDTNRYKIEANIFAAELMITDDDFFEAAGYYAYGYESLAYSFGVMPELLDYKLRSMKGRGIEGIEQVQYAQTSFWSLYNDTGDDVYST
jgi:Zn-dependent peptidase ImmA (M78 family)